MVSKSAPPSGEKSGLKTLQEETKPDSPDKDRADIMRDVMAKPSHIGKGDNDASQPMTGIVIGTLSDTGNGGQPSVYYPGIPGNEPVAAISTGAISSASKGDEIALGFINGDPLKPIILGMIETPRSVNQFTSEVKDIGQNVDVKLDGETLTLSADKEIVLKCGKSSITLTRAGKVIIKGAYLSNHSTGVNRIKGGSVQIN